MCETSVEFLQNFYKGGADATTPNEPARISQVVVSRTANEQEKSRPPAAWRLSPLMAAIPWDAFVEIAQWILVTIFGIDFMARRKSSK